MAFCSACAQAQDAAEAPPAALQRHSARLVLDYQTVKVQGDRPLDLAGLHVFSEVADGISVGAGLMGPLVSGQYGGFMGASVAVQGRVRLGAPLGLPVVGLATLEAGGGAGGRSPEHAKKLSGSGSFIKASWASASKQVAYTVGGGIGPSSSASR